jgi:hypothetical protein
MQDRDGDGEAIFAQSTAARRRTAYAGILTKD